MCIRDSNRGFKDKQPFALAPVAEVKGFIAAFHIKPEVPGCAALMSVAWYSVLVPSHKYGVMVGGFLVNIPGGKEKAHIPKGWYFSMVLDRGSLKRESKMLLKTAQVSPYLFTLVLLAIMLVINLSLIHISVMP